MGIKENSRIQKLLWSKSYARRAANQNINICERGQPSSVPKYLSHKWVPTTIIIIVE